MVKGSKMTDEQRARCSACQMGKKNPRTPEHQAKLNAARMGHEVTSETRAKISASKKGQRPSAETLAKLSVSRRGRVVTPEGRANISAAQKGKPKENQRGEQNGNWHGGEKITSGRVCILSRDHPHAHDGGYVLRYRLVMEAYLGRYLTPEEVIHHVDGDKLNDDLSNLMLFHSSGAHIKYHAELRRAARVQQDAVAAPSA